jgi:hypothetical protein
MVRQNAARKPSLRPFEAAYSNVKLRIVSERSKTSCDKVLVAQLKEEKRQLKDIVSHLDRRVSITAQYVFNMTDAVLELLRGFLKEELQTMLRGGRNDKNRAYVERQNELNVVLAEQKRRAEQVSVKSAIESVADAA